MAFNLSSYKHFAYRNSHNLEDFQISENFVYIITSNEIYEYKSCSSTFISLPLPFAPVSSFVWNQMFFICSKHDLYYFRSDLKHLIKTVPLTLNFEFQGNLMSIDKKRVRLVDLATLQSNIHLDSTKDIMSNSHNQKLTEAQVQDTIVKEYSFDLDNGICSAYTVFNSKIVLGFESGFIGWIQRDFGNSIIKINEVAKIDEPIISIAIACGLVFVSTIGKILRFPIQDERLLAKETALKSSDDEQNTSNIKNKLECLNLKEHGKIFTDIRCKKILVFENLLIAQQEKKITFLSMDLEIITCSIFQLEIKTTKVINGHLFIGFSCGLLVDFDLKSVRKKISG